MAELESWLEDATRGLSKESIAQVRTEIQEHCELARESTSSERLLTTALGDPRLANREYRKVLLTSTEARMLREGNWEARAVCSSAKLRWATLSVSLAAFVFVNVTLFLTGTIAWAPLTLALGAGVLITTPYLPVYTASRARVFRFLKWIALVGALWLAFAPNPLQWSWLWISSLWPIAWIEWKRIAIRRKLPVAQWPKQLYL